MENYNYDTYSTKQLFTIAKIRNLAPNTTFFASELGLNGAEIQSLYSHGFIAPTDKEIDAFIHIYGDYYKKIEIKEWKVREIHGARAMKLRNSLTQLKEVYNLFMD